VIVLISAVMIKRFYLLGENYSEPKIQKKGGKELPPFINLQ
jgi:hypothetical protein